MITFLIGENSFEIEQALNEIAAKFDGVVERIDGSVLQLNQLPDILMGVSLFSTVRTIVIRGLSENKSIWSVFSDWLPRISDDVHLVLIESKPDKRTAAFKALQKVALIQEFPIWTDRDIQKAEKWVTSEAKNLGLNMDNKSVQFLVARVGVDQWQLFYALQKLLLIDEITIESIKNVIDANPVENVFNLFETALSGDRLELKTTLNVLEQTEDIYRLSALLFSQVFQLAAVSAAEKADNPAKDFGIHPFVVSRMTLLAKRLGRAKVAQIVRIFADCDGDMKTSRAEPWLLLERALMKAASL